MSENRASRPLVVEAVADATGQESDEVEAVDSLFELPGFDSLAIASVLERLESSLRIEVPPQEIVPEAFETVESLTAVLVRATATHPSASRSET